MTFVRRAIATVLAAPAIALPVVSLSESASAAPVRSADPVASTIVQASPSQALDVLETVRNNAPANSSACGITDGEISALEHDVRTFPVSTTLYNEVDHDATSCLANIQSTLDKVAGTEGYGTKAVTDADATLARLQTAVEKGDQTSMNAEAQTLVTQLKALADSAQKASDADGLSKAIVWLIGGGIALLGGGLVTALNKIDG